MKELLALAIALALTTPITARAAAKASWYTADKLYEICGGRNIEGEVVGHER